MRHLKRPALLGLLLLACLLLAGCQMDSTVEELFTLPRLPTEYTTLSRQLDQLLSEGYEYMAPSRWWTSTATGGTRRWPFSASATVKSP